MRLALVLLLLLAACTAKKSAAPAVKGWTRADLKPVSQPAPVGNRFVVYTAADNQLSVEALDVKTGKTLWSDSATTSAIAAGQPPALTVSGKLVIYPHDLGRGAAEIVAADAETGTIAWRSGARILTGWPETCPDDAKKICATGTIRLANQPASHLRIDAATGALDSAIAIAKTIEGRHLGPGLFDPAERNPEYLVATRSDTIAWRRPLKSIFSLAGASTDHGWNFTRVNQIDMFIGTPGWAPTRETARLIVYDQSRSMTAGFRISDGSVVWASNGTRFICGYVPCPGGSQEAYSSPEDQSSAPTVGVRLRATGTLSGSPTSTEPTISRGARAILEGFDLATGKTKWSFDSGRNEGLLTLVRPPPRAGRESILVADARGQPAILDLADGSATSPGATAVFWCVELVEYERLSPDDSAETYIGQFALFPCGADQKRVAASEKAPGYAGTVSGGLVAWSEKAAVVALPLEK